MDKAPLRKRALAKRNALDEKTKRIYDRAIYNKVLPYLHDQTYVAIYHSFQSEVDTHALFQYCFDHQIAVCAPKIANGMMAFYTVKSFEDFELGHFGVMEPKGTKPLSPHHISMFLVPMLAYNIQGYRVGYGKGYYDRYLALNRDAITLGLAYSLQEIDIMFQETHDIALDQIITEE